MDGIKLCKICGRECLPTSKGYCHSCASALQNQANKGYPQLPEMKIEGTHVLCTINTNDMERDWLFTYPYDWGIIEALDKTKSMISICELGEIVEIQSYRE